MAVDDSFVFVGSGKEVYAFVRGRQVINSCQLSSSLMLLNRFIFQMACWYLDVNFALHNNLE